MPTDIKGPAIFLAQFAGDAAPFNSWDSITKWAASLGYKGVQIPSWDGRLFDLKKAAESKTYCDEILGVAKANGVAVTELSTHLQGQLVAVNPVYDEAFDAFAPAHVHKNPKARREWAEDQMRCAAKASKLMGLGAHVTFSGALAFPFLYPWPPRPPGLIEEAFDELARRWKPLLDVFDENGVDVGYEIHPGEDLMDGITFEMFLERVNNHPRCCINYDPSHFVLQALDYLQFIDFYHERIKAFHLNDSMKGLGSRVDRHAHIGRGELGLEPFRHLLNDPRFFEVPMYLETAKGEEDGEQLDAINLRTLKSLIAGRA